MTRPDALREHSVLIFVVGVLALNYPLLSLFSTGGRVFGLPLLYAYVFIAWLVLIGLVALVMRHSRAGAGPPDRK